MVQFGAILEDSKMSFETPFQSRFVDYEELKRVLVLPGTTSLKFEKRLDGEIEKSALFAMSCVGRIADSLREGGDVADAKRAMGLLVATIRFVELNLVALRKIVKKRDKFAARTGFAPSTGEATRQHDGASWLLNPSRSAHLRCLETLESQFASLLSSARTFRELTNNPSPRLQSLDSSRRRSIEDAPSPVFGSMMGSLIADGDAADVRALSELIESCDQALASAHTARVDLRRHAAAMEDVGVDTDLDYAKTLRSIVVAQSSSASSHSSSPPPLEVIVTNPNRRSTKKTAAKGESTVGFVDDRRFCRRWRDASKTAAATLASCFGGGQACDAGLAAQCSGAVLYAASCYAIAPTVHVYAAFVDAPTPAFAGLLLAATPLASLASRFAMSEWCKRYSHVGFKSPVILGGALCCAGNVLYCVAPTLARYRWLLALFARVAVGASGGADAVSRRYIGIADLPASERGAAAARYVASDAVGVALGPLLAAVCAAIIASSKRGRGDEFTLAVLTTPSLVLAAAWALHSLVVALLWQENVGRATAEAVSPPSATDSLYSRAEREGLLPSTTRTITAPSLTSPKLDQRGAIEYGATTSSSSSRRRRTTTTRNQAGTLRTLSSFPIRSSLARLFASSVVQEVFLASSALVTDHEFGWTPRLSGLLLCGLRVAGMSWTQSAEDIAQKYDGRAITFAAAAGALFALVLIPFFYDRLVVWLFVSFAAISFAEIMAVTEKSHMAKIATKKYSPSVAIAARVCGDLVFGMALATTTTSASDRTVMFTLWIPPSLCLFAALVSVPFVSSRTLTPLPSRQF